MTTTTITAQLPVYCVHESYNLILLPSRSTSLKVQPRLVFLLMTPFLGVLSYFLE